MYAATPATSLTRYLNDLFENDLFEVAKLCGFSEAGVRTPGYRIAVLAQTLQIKFNCLAYVGGRLGAR
jgi:hypothetical protein